QRAGLSVLGVGLPGHFVVKAVDEDEEILFDPFHGGRLLSREQCEILVEQVTGMPFQATAERLQAVPVGLIAVQMLANLKGIYLRQEAFPRAIRVIERLRQLPPDDPFHRRALGFSLIHAGQPGRGVDHLQAYLTAVPTATDASSIRQLLDRTRNELA